MRDDHSDAGPIVRARLVRLLQMAYSSEMAAALAYQGHSRSVRDPWQKTSLREIEGEEWIHRRIAGELLEQLQASPRAWREALFGGIGRALRFLCPFSGWFLPMFVAGLIERINVQQYVAMASDASALGLRAMAETLGEMADVERRHAAFFAEVLRQRRQSQRRRPLAAPSR